MKKRLSKSNTVAPLTARSSEAGAAREKPNPWLGKQVAQRLEDGRDLLIDLATELPFSLVLRGRVSPARKEVVAQAEPFCQVLSRHAGQLRQPVDLAYIRERDALIGRLTGFEKAAENFLGLIRRTRSVIAAQMENALRDAYDDALEASSASPDLARALQPFASVLGEPPQKGKKR